MKIHSLTFKQKLQDLLQLDQGIQRHFHKGKLHV